MAAGTDYPGVMGKHHYAAHVQLEQLLTPSEGRRLMRQIYRAIMAAAEENKAWEAVKRLGGEDHPSNLPWSRFNPKEAHCFWMMLTEYQKPVLAFRTHFASKETLKRLFNEVYKESDGRETLARSGWKADAKVWWIYAEHGYPALLGRLRREGFRLKWIQRSGFPPSPPVEEAP